MTAKADGEMIDAPDDIEAFNRFFDEQGWGDGLPVIPPTAARVDAMLRHSSRDRQDVVAKLAPAYGVATIERIAINAVLAGCRPEYFPVLVAAVQAISVECFNLPAMQVTTNPIAVWIIVNGPIVEKLGLNGGLNCLGQGTWANATIGRALHLVMQNVGGAAPGKLDRATQGQPGKYTFCCAENEAASPWPALHVERGYSAQCSTVTVIGASGTLSSNCHARDSDDLIRALGDAMAFPASNDYWIGGEPWLVLAPEHADVFHEAGLSKDDLKRRLWDASKMAAGRMTRVDFKRTAISRAAEFSELTPDTLLPISHRPEQIGIIVAGGPGTHSVYVPTFGDTRSVTREIEIVV